MKNKILICNDNNQILKNIDSIFKENNVDFDIAHNYQTLLDLSKSNNDKGEIYPIILTDLKVNNEDGTQTLKQLSALYPDTTIITMYSYNDTSVNWLNKTIRENNNILFLRKPFEDIELLQLVKNILAKFNFNNSKPTLKNNDADDCSCNDTITAVVTNISHEVRSPLESIVSLADSLKRTKLNDEQMRNVKAILRCSDSLLDIINDIVDFDQQQDQALTLNNSDFNFTDLIEGCVNLISKQALEKDVVVNMSISKDVPTFIHADEPKLRQLIWNLLTNALKYTNYGNVSVFAKYEDIKDSKTLTISIKDTGIGIEDKTLEKIFNKFNSDEPVYRSAGSDIGLSISKKLLDCFNGDIKVHSVVDQGSIFEISLPVQTVKDKTLQLQFGSFTPLNKQNGILLSSNPYTAQAIIEQFDKQNCTLVHAKDIRTARAKIQKAEYNYYTWCIIDSSVATTDNIPLLKNLILKAQQSSIKLLGTTKAEIAVDRFKKLGVYNTLSKPCFERHIRQKLSYHSDTSAKRSSPSLIPVDKISKSKYMKVLVAEDNEINQMVISEIFKRNGHTADIAKHGKIAVDKFKSKNYDLIILDLQMPIMGGVDAAKLIRNSDKTIPIIAMSSSFTQNLKTQCEVAGVNGFISKPITENKILDLFSRYSK